MNIQTSTERINSYFSMAQDYKGSFDRAKGSNTCDIEHWNNHKAFLKARYENPTLADTAYKEVLERKTFGHAENADFFKSIYEKAPDVNFLIEKAKKRVQDLYPKTASIREKLIKGHHIALFRVEPKLNIIQKVILLLK